MTYYTLFLIVLVLLMFGRPPNSVKRSKSVSKFVIESDNDETLLSPIKLGENGEQLAPLYSVLIQLQKP